MHELLEYISKKDTVIMSKKENRKRIVTQLNCQNIYGNYKERKKFP